MIFPAKLHRLLNQASEDPMLSQIISWLPCGKAFKIHDPFLLSELVLPLQFRGMNSFKSFRRQLNLYGIKKLLKSHMNAGKPTSTCTPAKQSETEKKDMIGAYYHPMFRRDKMELTAGMTRTPKHAFGKRNHLQLVRSSSSSRSSSKKWVECAGISFSGAHAGDGEAMKLVMGSSALSPREELRALLAEETAHQGLAWRSSAESASSSPTSSKKICSPMKARSCDAEKETTNFVLENIERLLQAEGNFSKSETEDDQSCSQCPQSPQSCQEEVGFSSFDCDKAIKKICINHDNDLLFMCSSDDSFDYDDIRREIIKTFLTVH